MTLTILSKFKLQPWAEASQMWADAQPTKTGPYLTGWCQWASLWWSSLRPSGCWQTGPSRGCSSWGPAWTTGACNGWWGAGTCPWCPAPPDAGPPRCGAYSCCLTDLQKGRGLTVGERKRGRLLYTVNIKVCLTVWIRCHYNHGESGDILYCSCDQQIPRKDLIYTILLLFILNINSEYCFKNWFLNFWGIRLEMSLPVFKSSLKTYFYVIVFRHFFIICF